MTFDVFWGLFLTKELVSHEQISSNSGTDFGKRHRFVDLTWFYGTVLPRHFLCVVLANKHIFMVHIQVNDSTDEPMCHNMIYLHLAFVQQISRKFSAQTNEKNLLPFFIIKLKNRKIIRLYSFTSIYYRSCMHLLIIMSLASFKK